MPRLKSKGKNKDPGQYKARPLKCVKGNSAQKPAATIQHNPYSAAPTLSSQYVGKASLGGVGRSFPVRAEAHTIQFID